MTTVNANPDAYPYGLVEVAGGSHAWLQPNGGWGLSNAGLIVDAGESLLVDTLFDLAHTQRMLDGFAPLTDPAPITAVVNTHGNGDHWFGNELVAGAQIFAATATIEEMHRVGPQALAGMLSAPGPVGDYGRQIFGRFDYTAITPTYPTRSFDGELVVRVGGIDILIEDVGPAHTRGDSIVYCERDRVVYTGDIVFAGGTPLVWAGPFANWVAACGRILDLDADLLVPGHGPVCTPDVVHTMVDYLEFVHGEAAIRHGAGMTAQEAAHDIDLGRFAALPESERLAVNVRTAYREFDEAAGRPAAPPENGPTLFGCMADLHGTH